MPTIDTKIAFSFLANHAETVNEAADKCASQLADCSAKMSYLRSEVIDLVAAPDSEAAKRELADTLLDAEARFDLAHTAIRDGVLYPKDMAEEIYKALMLRIQVTAEQREVEVEAVFRERARNIAAMYAYRVAKEPK